MMPRDFFKKMIRTQRWETNCLRLGFLFFFLGGGRIFIQDLALKKRLGKCGKYALRTYTREGRRIWSKADDRRFRKYKKEECIPDSCAHISWRVWMGIGGRRKGREHLFPLLNVQLGQWADEGFHGTALKKRNYSMKSQEFSLNFTRTFIKFDYYLANVLLHETVPGSMPKRQINWSSSSFSFPFSPSAKCRNWRKKRGEDVI